LNNGINPASVPGGQKMRYVRYIRDGQPRHGIVEQERVLEIEAPGDKKARFTGRSHEINDYKLLAPVMPGKVIGV